MALKFSILISKFKNLSKTTNVHANKTGRCWFSYMHYRSGASEKKKLMFCAKETPSESTRYKKGLNLINRYCSTEADSIEPVFNGSHDNDEVFKEIAKGNEEVMKELKKLELSISYYRGLNHTVPKVISKTNWEFLLKLDSYTSRMKFLIFLFKNEKMKENKIAKRKKCNLPRPFPEIACNPVIPRISPRTTLEILNRRLVAASMFSQNIIFDCSYENYMSVKCSRNCVTQLIKCFAQNRVHRVPFHVKLCNLNKNSDFFKYFQHCLQFKDIDWEYYEENYTDLFPKEKLVYLSPHSKTDLNKFDNDKIYIIGCYVDKGSGTKVSSAKAKEHDVKTARFPIDQYLSWGKGMKSLSLNTVLQIMLDLKLYDNWNKAFKNIPQRNLIKPVHQKFKYRTEDSK